MPSALYFPSPFNYVIPQATSTSTLTSNHATHVVSSLPSFLSPPYPQYDSNADALQTWLKSKDWLASMTTKQGHTVVQLASLECKKVIARRIYLMGRFKLAPRPAEHESITSAVSWMHHLFMLRPHNRQVPLTCMAHTYQIPPWLSTTAIEQCQQQAFHHPPPCLPPSFSLPYYHTGRPW